MCNSQLHSRKRQTLSFFILTRLLGWSVVWSRSCCRFLHEEGTGCLYQDGSHGRGGAVDFIFGIGDSSSVEYESY